MKKTLKELKEEIEINEFRLEWCIQAQKATRGIVLHGYYSNKRQEIFQRLTRLTAQLDGLK